MRNNQIIFFSSSKVIEGKDYSIICNFQKNKIKFIPNSMVHFINDLKKISIKEIKSLYPKDVYEEYLNFLLEEDFVFFSSKKEEFIEIKDVFDTPEIINNCIIEYDKNYNLKKAIKQLDNLLCKYYEIRFLNSDLDDIYNSLLFTEGMVMRSIRIFIPFSNYKEVYGIYNKLKSIDKIESIIFYNSPKEKLGDKRILFIKNSIDEIRKGNIDDDELIIDLNFYLECINHNPYYNKKVCIDRDGNIKNGIINKSIFGNIKNDKIKNIIEKTAFKNFWYITHDKIVEYKDDPLRYNKLISNDLEQVSNFLYKAI